MRISILAFFVLFSSIAFGQSVKMKRANLLFDQYAFADAIELYKEVIGSKDDFEAKTKLAECFRLTNNPGLAEEYYALIVDNEELHPIHVLHYAQALHSNGKCDRAKIWYQKYSFLEPNDPRGAKLSEACDMEIALAEPTTFICEPVSFNSEYAEFGPAFFRGGIVFSSSRVTDKKSKKHGWTGNPFLDIYFASGLDTTFAEPIALAGTVNSELNEGPVSFTSDFQTMIFTRNTTKEGKSKGVVDKANTINLNLYSSELIDGQWVNIKGMPFNTSEHTLAHPSISEDGTVLYFISDKPGGYGGSDIMVSYFRDSTWTRPKNLGAEINTSGNEMFPYLHQDGTLYFASDAHPGFGGLDVFKAEKTSNGWTNVRNLGFPINTSMDDFGLILNKEGDLGYLSSNRHGGRGDDDIYSLRKVNLIMQGTVFDESGSKALSHVKISLFIGKENVANVFSGSEGKFASPVLPFREYRLVYQKDGYHVKEEIVEVGNSRPSNQSTTLVKNKTEEKIVTCLIKVQDAATSQPVSDCKIELSGFGSREVVECRTDDLGNCYVKLKERGKYSIQAEKSGFLSSITQMYIKEDELANEFISIVKLEKLEIGKVVRLDNIYYNTNEWFIREDAKPSLNKLVTILADNPSLKVELRSHTDSRGDDDSNRRLSQNRADAAVNYIISKGIDSGRLVPKGYGESELVNDCKNGVECTEEKHEQNRRTEFSITDF